MVLIKRFEDILGWQEARKSAREIYGITRESSFVEDFGMGQSNPARFSFCDDYHC